MKKTMGRHYDIIGACSCWGAQIRACEKGPEDLVEGGVFDRLKAVGVLIRHIEMLRPKMRASEQEIPLSKALPLIHEFNLRLMKAVEKSLGDGVFPVILGGDHTNGVGTWNGAEGPFGLLWIDAHMDAHTPETSPSGAYHGMPIAALLGHGHPELAKLSREKPVLLPQNLALIGIRSFEEREYELLKRLNVKIYFMEEVRKRGMKAVLPEAIEHIARNTAWYGISLDLDAFLIDEAPGVGSPEAGGIASKDFLPLLAEIAKDPRLFAFEIVEFNPDRDVGHQTRELVFKILKTVMQ